MNVGSIPAQSFCQLIFFFPNNFWQIIFLLKDERYIESIPLSKDEQRYSGGYYSGGGHFVDETRDLSSLSNSSSGSHKHGGEILEPDRGNYSLE